MIYVVCFRDAMQIFEVPSPPSLVFTSVRNHKTGIWRSLYFGIIRKPTDDVAFPFRLRRGESFQPNIWQSICQIVSESHVKLKFTFYFRNYHDKKMLLFVTQQSRVRVQWGSRLTTNSMVYETRKFNAAFRRALPIIPILSPINSIPRFDTYFLKIHPNIPLQSTPRPS